MQEYVESIRKQVLEQMDLGSELSDEQVLEFIDEAIVSGQREHCSLNQRMLAREQVFSSLRGLDILQELIDEPQVTEIMVNGYKNIFYEKNGSLHKWNGQFSSKEKLEDTIQSIVAAGNRMVNEAEPIVDTRLRDGSRVNIVLSPIALDGSVITIRKFPEKAMTMDELLKLESLSEEICIFLRRLVVAGYNLFISGGTGSGKTTFLNALSGYIPSDERVITIEDSAELQLSGIDNLVRLETRNSGLDSVSEISIRQLIRTALRMRPDRIIVGECRGAEALDMLQAMNTGHDGSLSTGHANSCRDMIARLETMVLMGMDLPVAAIRSQIASGIDVLIHLGRLRDRSRKLLDIMEVDRVENGEVILQPLYRYKEDGQQDGKITGHWETLGTLHHKEKLLAAGLEVSENRLS
ncbi:MAG: CpaF family protein [bacterium]|nr:CpaF family protein [bacterium]